MTKKSRFFNTLFLIAGILCFLFYLGQGITVRFGQSLLWLWALAGAAFLARYFLWKRAWKRGKPAPVPHWIVVTVRVCVLCVLVVFVFIESFILPAAFRPAPDGLDAIVILGARVEENGPSGSLSERIWAAEDYLRRNPGTVAVASGGQGSDEPMSEAACIRDYLLAAGIDEGRILLEDSSTSTFENLSYSFALLGDDIETVGIVTNDFHVYRAVRVAEAMDIYEISGVPARSNIFGFVHYALREFFAVGVSLLRGTMALA